MMRFSNILGKISEYFDMGRLKLKKILYEQEIIQVTNLMEKIL